MTGRRSLGVVVGKFLPPHRGHSHLIDTACAGADDVMVIVCARADDPIPPDVRVGMLRELHPSATIVVTPDDISDVIPDDDADATSRAWAQRTRELAAVHLGRRPEVAFTSEEYGPRFAHHLGAGHVSVDPDRRRFPISGTQVRADPWAAARFLAPCVRAWYVRRVRVLGAESTGTTTLCRDLAKWYGCAWVPEYGRAYCERRGAAITWRSEDFDHIARGQLDHEDRAARIGSRLLVCDTDALATSVWHERDLGIGSDRLRRLAATRRYAATVLTSDDIPFIQDGTRDGQHIRGWMTDRFRSVLAAEGGEWIEVRGDRCDRLAAAVEHIDAVVTSPAG